MTNQPRTRIEVIGETPGHRGTLGRMVVMYSLLSAGGGAISLISLSAVLAGSYGALIPLTLLLLVTGAACVQFVTAALDLRAKQTFTSGEVRRLWTKGGLLWFFRSHYVMVERRVFVMSPDVWVQLSEGNTVELHHWPHTRTLIRSVLISGELDDLVPGETVTPPADA